MLIEAPDKLAGMRRQRGKERELLKKEVGERIKKLMGNMKAREFAKRIDNIVDESTVWTYVNGLNLPSPEVQLRIAREFGVTTDYLLTGQDSLFSSDFERAFINELREAEKLGIAEEIKKFMEFRINQKKQDEDDPSMENKKAEGG